MKRLFFYLLIFVLVVASHTTAYAAEKAYLGTSNIAVKLDYIDFYHDVFERNDVDKGLYIGLEGYRKIISDLYLGMEVGYTNIDGEIKVGGRKTEVTFVPVELNLKYAIKVVPDSNFVIDFGAGVSYNYFEEKISRDGTFSTDNDWLVGGQVFADLNYSLSWFFFGIHTKYQATDKRTRPTFSYHYHNWRFGGQIGILF